jgi:hypothetical protein
MWCDDTQFRFNLSFSGPLLLTQGSDGWATRLRRWHGNVSVLAGLMAGVIEIGCSTWVSYGVCGVQEHSPEVKKGKSRIDDHGPKSKWR